MVIGLTRYKSVNGFTDEQLNLMRAFDNYYWQGTPLMPLYTYYLNGDEDNHDYAVEEAGKAAGRLLKEVLMHDKRTFTTQEGYTRMYRWTGEEEN